MLDADWNEVAVVPPREVVLFTRNLSCLLENGIDIVRSIDTLAHKPECPNFGLILNEIAEDLSNGASLSQSARRFPKVFGPLFCSMVEVGENTGRVAETLARVGSWMEREQRTRHRIKSALTYPGLVLVVAVVLMFVMFTTAIPQFFATFKSMGTELPLLTRVVMGITDLAQNPGALALGLTAAFGLRAYLRDAWDDPDRGPELYTALLSVPVAGRILRNASVVRFASVLELTISTGLDISKSVLLACAASGSKAIEKDASELLESVKSGAPLSTHFREHPLIYSEVLHHITLAGEEAADLAESMAFVAKIHEAELELAVHEFSILLEPILLVFVAGIVGTILLSVFLPLYAQIGAIA